jgi:hypothetical protein
MDLRAGMETPKVPSVDMPYRAIPATFSGLDEAFNSFRTPSRRGDAKILTFFLVFIEPGRFVRIPWT